MRRGRSLGPGEAGATWLLRRRSSFIHLAKRVLFVGDAAANQRRLGLPPPFMTEDMDEAKRSLRKIASLDSDTAVFLRT